MSYKWTSSKGAVEWSQQAMRARSSFAQHRKAAWCLPSIPLLTYVLGIGRWSEQSILVICLACSAFCLVSLLLMARHIKTINSLWAVRPRTVHTERDLVAVPEHELRDFLVSGQSVLTWFAPSAVALLACGWILRPLVRAMIFA